VESKKQYISFAFIGLLILSLVDFHGLSHVFEGDHSQQVEVCDDCSIVFQQKEDIHYLPSSVTENLVVEPFLNSGENTVKFAPVYYSVFYSSDYFNKPPPSLG
jgi:hypothetical protein